MQDTSPKTSKPRKKRTRKPTQSRNQPSLDSFARRPAVPPNEANPSEPTLAEDLNLDRRKRRKTTPLESTTNSTITHPPAADLRPDLYDQLQAEAAFTGTQEVIDQVMVDTLVETTPKSDALVSSPPIAGDVRGEAVPDSSLPHAAHTHSRPSTPPLAGDDKTQGGNEDIPKEAADIATAETTSKKQIKVTKTGKLVSSPPKQPDPPTSTTPKRRGRPRKAAKNRNLSSTITIIRYGSDKASRLALGQKIDAILSSGKPVEKHVSILPPKPAGPPKAPHPFFTGKASQKTAEASTKPQADRPPVNPRKSACTPGKLRAERRKEQDDEEMPAFGRSHKSHQLAKQSGLHEPSWPSQETAHVRNLTSDPATRYQLDNEKVDSSLSLKPSKLKGSVYTLSAEEEVITKLSQQLSADPKTRTDAGNQPFTPCEDVRLPTRLLTTGIDIQNKVRAHIRAPIETLAQRLYAKTHPAITTLFDDIEHTLTPFDEGRCESQAWVQKYRPVRADHVLQPGREANVLKDWLKSLTVMAVGAVQDPAKATVSSDTRKPAKKKRKTAADDFIVFSDEEDEDEEMIELDANYTPATHQLPSLRRPRWTRNKNVVLLSGPHGCGKSATVFAVAKELDFEVFELHSGVRRSGKDIQDKVGDMTANHLVNHQRGDMPAKPKPTVIVADNDTDNERDNAFQKDLDSGRQGTMTSFFAAKPAVKPKSKPRPKAQVVIKSPAKTRTIPAAQAMLPITGSSRKSQKQSLILIEEADILFEEDQNFWAQVIKLAAQSKRPVVITCNDELQIPTQSLPMAAVLRLAPPPLELATDYMVALTGREGHILQRQAISDLYVSKDHDLRASITELNFWCQMSVGDKKGGLEWMFQRWPPGKDVDANGRLLRVASEDTYRSGMGWLSHNVFQSHENAAFDKEAELLTEAWNDWEIRPIEGTAVPRISTNAADSNATTPRSNLEDLDRLVVCSDALSAADLYSRIDLPSYDDLHHQPMDPTLPSLTPKERLSYTIDKPILQVDPRTDYLNTDTKLATTTHILAARAFPAFTRHQSAESCSPDLEHAYTSLVLQHKNSPPPQPLQRPAFSSALDILATAPPAFNTYPQDIIDHRTSYNLLASSLDRTFPIITLDIAPYVRSIVAHEQVLETQRIRLGNLLSEGGAKRGRTTKASRTAMEGGERAAKRRERWFHKDLNFELVMRTAGTSWAGMGSKPDGEGDGSVTGSLTGTQVSESLGGTQQSGGGPGGSQSAVGDVEMIVDAEGN